MATATTLTPNDLIGMVPPPTGVTWELSQGELIIVGTAGATHERVKSNLHEMLVLHLAPRKLGKVLGESMFALNETTARIPDVAILFPDKAAQLQGDRAIPFAPDIAIEIVSNSATAADTERKVHEYLAAGTKEVWQVYLDPQLVRVRTAFGPKDYLADSILSTSFLPGFAVPVNGLFA